MKLLIVLLTFTICCELTEFVMGTTSDADAVEASSSIETDIFSECPDIPLLYEEVGCKPVIPLGQKCPIKFVCPNFLASIQSFCFFRGKQYKVGETIDHLHGLNCPYPSCTCTNNTSTNAVGFICSSTSCAPPPASVNTNECIVQQKLNACCPTGYICGERAIDKLPTCSVGDRTYYQGQIMPSPYNSCSKCRCSQSLLSPFIPPAQKECKRHYCAIELFHAEELIHGCAPVYDANNICCPIGYRCPRRNDFVIRQSGALVTKNNSWLRPTCNFGKLTLRRGDLVSKGRDKCLVCTCKYPPMVQCQTVPNCTQ